ncbi:DUF624 domain-containing protein [Rhizobium rhizogenes]|jgi:hypothetical protein|uniref:DUF624 domain-containing protein n=2 Tax=Rhizobium/Agrobacterium group TaxID=227290 RepID=A0AB36EME6_AGRTU|nr:MULTISPECIES: DUF624 domain-containing protein [Rhizobium/Agrobacterium group]EHJ95810.1 hypothetical protein AT5A_24030 [Agrobacterium tumefaciens 5A]ADY67349.1 hypothetical protein AGROH133_13270 [Agrobacterium tumefaciens]KAA3499732.1 DUF624 domain-containing protein [Agrobacterium tumefaciens]KQY40284.1 hypothetical protein ASD46_19095 [Rhizobium sp. Root491]MDR5011260.1 DUF624 domain-containing protein [Agrobacterium tumefaciens]
MQWLEGLWTKEGAGIDKNAPPPTGLALFLDIIRREWWEMVKLNLLFIIASLPVVTMPAAMLAMGRVCVSFSNDENTYLLRDFLEALRTFALRGTALVLLAALVVGGGGYATVSYADAARSQLAYSVPFAISLAVTLFLTLLCAYATVVLAKEDLPLLQTLRRAAFLALTRPWPMLAALSFVAALWIAHILFYPVSVFMPATINFSLGMFALCFAARNVAAQTRLRISERAGSGV